MFPNEPINDSESLTRWAYNPAVGEDPPTKGLKFQSDPPHNSCESCNWNKYLADKKEVHGKGCEKAKATQQYLGFYHVSVSAVRNVHRGKSYESTLWFEVNHTPNPDNQAHTDIKLIKNDTIKIIVKQAKVDLAKESFSVLESARVDHTA